MSVEKVHFLGAFRIQLFPDLKQLMVLWAMGLVLLVALR